MDVSLLTNKWFSNYQKMYFSNKIVATTKLQSWEKKEHVCFSRVCLSVILLTEGRGFPCDYYPWCTERQIQGPPRHIQTCLTCLTSLWRDPLFWTLYAPPHWNLFIMKHVWLANGQLASKWNAEMFFCSFEMFIKGRHELYRKVFMVCFWCYTCPTAWELLR